MGSVVSNRARTRTSGTALVEFSLIGIPLIFILLVTFEMSRGMWCYQTLAYAVKTGARYTIVHGQDCERPPNTCTVTISQIASVIKYAGVGLADDLVTLKFTDANGSATSCSLHDCIANYNTAAWPPSSANAPGRDVRISGTFVFKSSMLIFWPGAVKVGKPMGAVQLSADSRESIQF